MFGPMPIDPRTPHASLAAAQSTRPSERAKPVGEESQRLKDAREQRVAGAESEAAVRRTADEHAESDSERRRRRDRRDGRRDAFVHEEPTVPAAHAGAKKHPNAAPPAPDAERPHIDLRG